jgi:transposase
LYSCPKVIKAPSQSPDLNVIENLWAQLEREVSNHSLSNKGLKALRDEWKRTSPEYTQQQNW